MAKKDKKKKGEEEKPEEGAEGAAAEEKPEAAPAAAGEGGEPSAEGAAGEGGEAAPKKSKKKLFIIIGAVLVVALIGAGVVLSGVLGGGQKKKAADSDPDMVAQTIYYDMDSFLVNLNNPGSTVSFLKAVITLELPNEASHKEVQEKMPRIRDAFQVYLRELRSSDLQGSAGLQRLRAELLLRINSIMEKGKVNNILFKEIIVQ